MLNRRSGDHERQQQQRLYIVFDDWSRGYSIRGVDLHQLIGAGVTSEGSIHCTELPEPPIVLRLDAPRGLPMYFAAAFGTKIMAMHPVSINGALHHLASEHHVPVVDVLERGLILGPRPDAERVDPIYILVGDMLFALAADSFEFLHPPPIYVSGRQSWKWSWVKLPKPPMESKFVTSYAVHPDGKTIFISLVSPISRGTFTFDHRKAVWERVIKTKEQEDKQESESDDEDGEVASDDQEDEDDEEEEQVFAREGSGWEQHGQWTLPFIGCAHFDPDLDAWVGLDSDSIGYICCCDALSVDANNIDRATMERKISKEKFFTEEPGERHLGAKLLYLGNGSNFCLVESIIKRGSADEAHDCKQEGHDVSGPARYLFRLLTFSLKYDKNGCLTTGNSRKLRYCNVPTGVTELTLKNPVAFWM